MRKLLAILVISCWATSAVRTKGRPHCHQRKDRDAGSPHRRSREALAVREGKIVAVGGNDAVEGLDRARDARASTRADARSFRD